MGVTRFSVYGGLAGMWIVRDERERELGLPEGPPYELPLLLSPTAISKLRHGAGHGSLHKTDPEVMECFGPFTVVNGAIWPRIEVEPATYRFRVLNGSNARTYRLVLTRDGEPDLARITQIGTEGGLLLAPVSIPARAVAPASAERADLLVILTLRPGRSSPLDTATAPFDGTVVAAETAGHVDVDGLLPYPEVLRIVVTGGALPRVASRRSWRRTFDGPAARSSRTPPSGRSRWSNRRPWFMVHRPC